MALKKDFTTAFGVVIPNTYIRIDSFSGNKENIYFNVGIYNIVPTEQEIITTENKQVETITSNGETIIEYVPEDIISHETVDVKKRIEGDGFNMIPDLLSTDNIIKQGYIALKNMDKYKDSIDC